MRKKVVILKIDQMKLIEEYKEIISENKMAIFPFNEKIVFNTQKLVLPIYLYFVNDKKVVAMARCKNVENEFLGKLAYLPSVMKRAFDGWQSEYQTFFYIDEIKNTSQLPPENYFKHHILYDETDPKSQNLIANDIDRVDAMLNTMKEILDFSYNFFENIRLGGKKTIVFTGNYPYKKDNLKKMLSRYHNVFIDDALQDFSNIPKNIDYLVIGDENYDPALIRKIVNDYGITVFYLPQEAFIDLIFFGHNWYENPSRLKKATKAHLGLQYLESLEGFR